MAAITQRFKVVTDSAPTAAYWDYVMCAELVVDATRTSALPAAVSVTLKHSLTYRRPAFRVSLLFGAANLRYGL